jgi:SAM-dependent methyltransferase
MKDIFGKALYSYWKGNHKTPYIVRRNDDYAGESSLKPYFSKQLYPTEKAVARYAKGKILDIGCGAGRHTLYYQKRGHDITGIDSSPLAIKVCKERGCSQVQVMDILHPKTTLPLFDTILLFGHNIGIGGTLAEAKTLLASLKKIIKTDGLLLLTSLEVTRPGPQVDGKDHKKKRAAPKYIGEMIIRVEYRNQSGNWFHWLHIDPKMLKKLAEETGWKILTVHQTSNGEYSAVLSPKTGRQKNQKGIKTEKIVRPTQL